LCAGGWPGAQYSILEIKGIKSHTNVGEMLPYIFAHQRNTNGMIGVDVDMVDFDVIFSHVDQYIVAGFDGTQIIVQTDEAELFENAQHINAIFVVSNHIVWTVTGDITLVVQDQLHIVSLLI
jgi:hypothetical protein